MSAQISKEYTNGELTVVWQPGKCIHAKVCVDTLPNVYDPEGRPWINPENATTEELKSQIDQCPSGALSYYMNAEGKPSEVQVAEKTKVQIMKDGPLLVTGTLSVESPDGHSETKANVTAFCRCGASHNKPYCDGQHKEINFQG